MVGEILERKPLCGSFARTGFGDVLEEARAGNTGLVHMAPESVAVLGSFVEGEDSGITQTIAGVTPGAEYEFSAHTRNARFEDPITDLNENFMFGKIIFPSATDAPWARRSVVLEQDSPSPFDPSTSIRFAFERAMPSGVYLYVLQTDGGREARSRCC